MTLTATVAGSGTIPSGTVTFLSGGVAIGSVALNGSGVASLTTIFSGAGTDLITATYSGNGKYSSANSLAPVSETVNPRQDIWSGARSGAWDINTTSNWLYLGGGSVYHDTDAVQFDDTALSNTSLVLNVPVNPNAVVFANNVKTYSLGGTGALAGATGLTLVGTGTLIVSNTNSYLGNTLVSNGVLTFTAAGSSTGGGNLYLGGDDGIAVLNQNGTNNLTFGNTCQSSAASPASPNDFGSR